MVHNCLRTRAKQVKRMRYVAHYVHIYKNAVLEFSALRKITYLTNTFGVFLCICAHKNVEQL